MIPNALPEILSKTKKNVFDALGFELKNMSKDPESDEYSAYTFELSNRKIIFRNAKTTPKKVGQFVTFWKRNQSGITKPFELSDDFDFAIINVESENQHGQFVFPKSALLQHGIISSSSKQGKCGFRIYPIWDKATNKQAMKAQQWQRNYFLEIIPEKCNLEIAKSLYLTNP